MKECGETLSFFFEERVDIACAVNVKGLWPHLMLWENFKFLKIFKLECDTSWVSF